MPCSLHKLQPLSFSSCNILLIFGCFSYLFLNRTTLVINVNIHTWMRCPRFRRLVMPSTASTFDAELGTPYAQWAAVSTHWRAMIVPPHRCWAA